MEQSSHWLSEDELHVAKCITDIVTEHFLGRGACECVANHPRDVYFIGNLRNRPSGMQGATAQAIRSDELMNKLSPMAFGLDCEVSDIDWDRASIRVQLRWSCYYRVFPTLEQQRQYQIGSLRRAGRPVSDGDQESAQAGSEEETPRAARSRRWQSY